jgi:NADPH-dependent 2,4-dienoyl-CoA reductase/sulfur reductase-like enzyme
VSRQRSILVVGAGIAGLRACEGLRSLGFEGRIVLAGAEAHAPYDRPPLSKQFLSGEWAEERLVLRSAEALASLGLETRFGPEHTARALDLGRRVVRFAGGEAVGFDGLVIATGAEPRRLPGASELEQAHVLRTLEDARALRPVLQEGARLLVVGAGFIGLEVAATARRRGVEVDVVDPLAVPLGQVLGETLGGVVRHKHESHGVRFHMGSSVTAFVPGRDGTVRCDLADGTSVDADAVVVGIGVAPSVGWLLDSGLDAGPDGVLCDGSLLAGPGVVAAGDLARFPLLGTSATTVRVEHRTTAAELGEHAARTLLAELTNEAKGAPSMRPDPFGTVLYVWSDQYDVKIQILGRPGPDDVVRVVEGDVTESRFVACYGRAGRLTGVVAFSQPRVLMKFRPLLERGASFGEAVGLELG